MLAISLKNVNACYGCVSRCYYDNLTVFITGSELVREWIHTPNKLQFSHVEHMKWWLREIDHHGGSMLLEHDRWNWNNQISVPGQNKWTLILILNETDPHNKRHSVRMTTYMKGNWQNKWEWVHGEYKCGGDTVCTTVRQVIDGMCDLGNSGEESIILTSDGTVADRRGRREGHHFSGGGVKQARDVSARVRMRKLIWRTLLIIIIIITADSINYWQKKQRYEVYIVKNRMWYPVVTSRTVRWVTAYLWLQYCSHFPLQENKLKLLQQFIIASRIRICPKLFVWLSHSKANLIN